MNAAYTNNCKWKIESDFQFWKWKLNIENDYFTILKMKIVKLISIFKVENEKWKHKNDFQISIYNIEVDK